MYIEKYPGDLAQLQKSLYPVIYNMAKIANDELAEKPDTPDLNVSLGTTTAFIADGHGRNLHTNPIFNDVTDFVNDASDRYFDVEGLSKDNKQIIMAWANVYPKGSFIRPHYHSFVPNICSAVFYLKSYDNSGRLFLKDDPQSYLINEGEMCLFQSGIEHWTTPNENDEDRIMIGYDIYYGELSEVQIKILLRKAFRNWHLQWS